MGKTGKATIIDANIERRARQDYLEAKVPLPEQSTASEEDMPVNRSLTILAGTWRITRLLSCGGMGEVWEGKHLRTEMDVAVKFLRKAKAQSPEVVDRFRAEAVLSNKIRHDDVVKILDQNVDDHQIPYLVMERLIGKTADAWIAHEEPGGGRATVNKGIAWLARQLLDVLVVAHEESIIHRDLKPNNLFVTETPRRRLRVFDFGIAKARRLTGIVTRTGEWFGTPGFMAPEQTKGRSDEVTHLVDIWGVGATLFKLLTRRRKFLC